MRCFVGKKVGVLHCKFISDVMVSFGRNGRFSTFHENTLSIFSKP